ncbi:MAG: hypothetical protein GY769_00375 [bacterium]|nr:hypothetical protein [bacterium]
MPSYSTALVFSRESAGNLDGLSGAFCAAELEELGRYLDEQPDSVALGSMTDGESRALSDHRAWALIHFLRSLVAP